MTNPRAQAAVSDIEAKGVRLAPADRAVVESAVETAIDAAVTTAVAAAVAAVVNDRANPPAEIRSPILRSHARSQRPQIRN